MQNCFLQQRLTDPCVSCTPYASGSHDGRKSFATEHASHPRRLYITAAQILLDTVCQNIEQQTRHAPVVPESEHSSRNNSESENTLQSHVCRRATEMTTLLAEHVA